MLSAGPQAALDCEERWTAKSAELRGALGCKERWTMVVPTRTVQRMRPPTNKRTRRPISPLHEQAVHTPHYQPLAK
eukprot:366125-Chlamydomonas_euryale.AAC.2